MKTKQQFPNLQKISDKEVKQFFPMVDKFIRDFVIKNFRNSGVTQYTDEMTLGNTGLTVSDLRQYLRMETVIAIRTYKPDRGMKLSSYVHLCLFSRIGQKMKSLVKLNKGYGIKMVNLDQITGEYDDEK